MKDVFQFTFPEISDIATSVLAIALALAIAGGGLQIFTGYPDFLILLFFLLLTVGSGFILHELAHRFMAILYGGHARFRMWKGGIVMMLLLSVFGFVFAAPGAVYIYGLPVRSKKMAMQKNGIISLVGPGLNIVLMLFFLLLGTLAPLYFRPVKFDYQPLEFVGSNIWFFGAWINFILALFNILPVFPLDGSKIFYWSKPIWILLLAFLLIVGMTILPPLYLLFILFWMLMIIALAKFFLFRR